MVAVAFDYELTLINSTYTDNGIGDSIPNESKTVILCNVESVSRHEHYAAAAHELQPEIIFIVNQYDYSGEKEVEFEGVKYYVIRSYKPRQYKGLSDFETLELVCRGVR